MGAEHETAVRKLYDDAAALHRRVRAIAERTGTREDWEAAVWLERALYDLWGARSWYDVRDERAAQS